MTLAEESRFIEAVDPGTTTVGADLRLLSRWQIGGLADLMYEPTSTDQLARVLQFASAHGTRYSVIGDTSNILFDSQGYRGLLVRIGSNFSDYSVQGRVVTAGAGVRASDLARVAERFGLSGIEHIVGIPGTLGGLIAMNGGSMRRGISENVLSIDCLTKSGDRKQLDPHKCKFAYRSSIFQGGSLIIIGAVLGLAASTRGEVGDLNESIIETRRDRFPELLPNCGSTFASDPSVYATVGSPGKMLESAGLKGYHHGDAQYSPQHANFIINRGNATSDDVLELIALGQYKVLETTGHRMRCEVRFLPSDGETGPADDFVPQQIA
ncbi:UDP-N-acetylmuramate dehydrogenase [Nesterenkonia sp. AN1]|uniref:UDP-N-acetylmuramate dehydrogenase n=1 Tax=Nesterenkonia sp. AN1 TaxID=652017 RepID=UPI0009FE0E4A|nr:UDP-N-acetylmuramate dehydrogenase [Nesterenkonia sp. AN1]